jgi:hypothetical protein
MNAPTCAKAPAEHAAQKHGHTDDEPDVARAEEKETRHAEHVDLATL